MTAVVQTLRSAGLFELHNVQYVSTYNGAGMKRQLLTMARATTEVLSLLATGRVGLVHAHTASRGSFWRKSALCTMARMMGVPYILHVHSGEFPAFYHDECGPVAKWWIRMNLQRAACVVSLSIGWKANLQAIAPNANVEIVGNPVEVPSRLPPLRADASRVLFMGRLRKKKGVFDLLEAIPLVLAVLPHLRFVLAGDEGEHAVREKARALGVEYAIELPGWVDGAAKAKLQEEADVFVLPSYFEGLPMGVLEGMALGIPVISTGVGAIPEVIVSGQHGLLVEPGNVAQIADSIIRICSDKSLRQKLREAAHERVTRRYRTDGVITQLSAIYLKLHAEHTQKT